MRDDIATEACEESATALWIAVVLTVVKACGPLSGFGTVLLSCVVAMQYLLLGLLLPRPECGVVQATAAPHGALLGLSPLWASFVQLCVFSSLLPVQLYRAEWSKSLDVAWGACLRGALEDLADPAGEEGAKLSYLENGLERVVKDLERAEIECQEVLAHAAALLACSPPEHSSHTWVSVFESVSLSVSRCCASLKLNTKDRQAQDIIDVTLEAASVQGGAAGADAVSGWIMQDARRESTAPHDDEVSRKRSGSRDMSHSSRADVRLRTISGARANLRVAHWDFDSLKVQQEHGNVLSIVGFELLRSHAQVVARKPLTHLLLELEVAYMSPEKVPYHSSVHGADMTNSLYCMAMRSGFLRHADLSDALSVTMLLAALGHDVGHFGRNNLFLINSRDELAVTYNDRSVLENFHAATFTRMLERGYPCVDVGGNAKVLSQLDSEQQAEARQTIHALILCTDMASHLQDFSSLRIRLGSEDFDPLGDKADRQQALQAFFRAADIAHSAKAWAKHEAWSLRVAEEFHAQGDEEQRLGLKVSPLCSREGFMMETSQMGFLNFICLPTWKELAKLETLLRRQTKRVVGEAPPPVEPTQTGRASLLVGRRMRPATPSDSNSPRLSRNEGHAVGRVQSHPQRLGGAMSARPSLLGAKPLWMSARPSWTSAAPHPHLAPAVEKSDTLKTPSLRRRSAPKFMREVVLRQCEVNHSNWKARNEGLSDIASDVFSSEPDDPPSELDENDFRLHTPPHFTSDSSGNEGHRTTDIRDELRLESAGIIVVRESQPHDSRPPVDSQASLQLTYRESGGASPVSQRSVHTCDLCIPDDNTEVSSACHSVVPACPSRP